MPAPWAQQLFYYGPTSYPILVDDPDSARPVGVGSLATGGDNLSLEIGLNQFDGPVDIYFGIYAPDLDPNNIYILKPDNTLTAQDFVPWKSNTSGPVNENLYGDVPASGLPPGNYNFYLLVTPAGSTNSYYLWETSAIVPQPTCTFEDVTSWNACQHDDTQTAAAYASTCTPPATPLVQMCIYSPPTCSYIYSDWGSCQPDGTQTRTVISSNPAGCSGTPDISQTCSDAASQDIGPSFPNTVLTIISGNSYRDFYFITDVATSKITLYMTTADWSGDLDIMASNISQPSCGSITRGDYSDGANGLWYSAAIGSSNEILPMRFYATAGTTIYVTVCNLTDTQARGKIYWTAY